MSEEQNDKAKNSNYWTDDRIQKLKTHFSEGLSGTRIAELLGGDITRSAVMGKLNRLGLRQKDKKIETKKILVDVEIEVDTKKNEKDRAKAREMERERAKERERERARERVKEKEKSKSKEKEEKGKSPEKDIKATGSDKSKGKDEKAADKGTDKTKEKEEKAADKSKGKDEKAADKNKEKKEKAAGKVKEKKVEPEKDQPKQSDFISTKELIEIFQGKTEKIDPNKPVTIMGLTERTCRWPIGDPFDDDFHFCGKESEEDGPYCKEHSEISYQQPKRAEPAAKK